MKKTSIQKNKKKQLTANKKKQLTANKKKQLTTNKITMGGGECFNKTKNNCIKNPNCDWTGALKTTGTGANMRHSACVKKPTKTKKACIGRNKTNCVSPCNWVNSSGYCRPGNY